MGKYSNLFLVVNLGCEMLYIIQHRINAQDIPDHRGVQVLTDITGVLLNETLLEDLTSAKSLASHEYVRTLLQDIVSVSIMRLDSYSMRKLWELMTMVFKWQLTLTNKEKLSNLTTRHLHGISKISQLQSSLVQGQIGRTVELIEKIELETTVEEMVLIRNSLMNWFCDFRTNVSHLLRLGYQRKDGSFILNNIDEKCVQNLGENIYSTDTGTLTPIVSKKKYPNNSTLQEGDFSELPFVINFTGNDNLAKDKRKIKFRFLDDHREGTSVGNIGTPSSSVSYSQTKSVNNQKTYLSVNDEHFPHSLSSTIHDDLIKMLDNNDID